MVLHVLRREVRELAIDDDEHQQIDKYLSEQAALHEQLGAEWEVQRAQAAEWRKDVERDARRGFPSLEFRLASGRIVRETVSHS